LRLAERSFGGDGDVDGVFAPAEKWDIKERTVDRDVVD
jgi:hypothetical protein